MSRFLKIFTQNRLLIVILLFAAFIRLSFLTLAPPSLNWDEVSHGYNAYSILKSGRDEWGVLFPTLFRAFGDYKLPVYIYATTPFVAIFGLSEFSVRFVSAIAGVLTVLFTYLLVKELFRPAGPASRHPPVQLLATLSAIFVAIEPWSFFLSRVAVEANLALFLIIAGAWFFLTSFEKRTHLVISALLFGLSVWTYNSARIFVPLLLVVLVVLYKDELIAIWKKKRKVIIYSSLLVALFFIPMFLQLFNPGGLARYQWVQILDEGAKQKINQARNASELPDPLPLFFHNKVTYFSGTFARNYMAHFSPSFLFFQGGSHYQFSVPGKGLIYPTELIFIVIGLGWLIARRDKAGLVILAWLLLAPVASSLTREAPHVLRSIIMQPIPQLLAAVGLVAVWGWIKKNSKFKVQSAKFLVAGIYIIALLFFVEGYAREYVGAYRTNYSWAWQYGYKEAVQFMKQNYQEYDQIIMSKKYGEPHEFVLAYWPWDPEEYRNDPSLIRFFQSNWYWVDRFDKFYFVNDWEVPKSGGEWKLESGGIIPLDGRTLLITSPGNYPSGWQLLETIYFLDGKPAFEILEST